MNHHISIRNRQRAQSIDTRFLKTIGEQVASDLFGKTSIEIGIQIVSPSAMAKVNEKYLNHTGPTDVITFDLSEPPFSQTLLGEIYICLAVAVDQAEEFKTSWQSEIIRYLIHGLLHLKGYDDRTSNQHRSMKRIENRLMKALAKQYDFQRVAST